MIFYQISYCLQQVLFCLMILLLMPRKDPCRLLLYSCICFVTAIVINTFSTVRVIELTIVNGRLLTGPSYIMLGVLVNCKKSFFSKKYGLLIPIIMCGISMIWKLPYSTVSVVAFLSVPWIIGFIMHFQVVDSLSNQSKICRKISSIIYFSHMYFLFIWMYLLPIEEKGMVCFLFVAVFSCLFSILVSVSKK